MEDEKVEKYQDLRTKVIPAVMGALGSEPIVNLATARRFLTWKSLAK